MHFLCRLASNVSLRAISVQPKEIFGLGQGLKKKTYKLLENDDKNNSLPVVK